MSRYLRSVPEIRTATPKELDAMPDEEVQAAPKTRKARGTSEFVQVKVHRSIYEALAVVAKARSMKVPDVVEKFLEIHVAPVNSALEALKMENIF